MPYVLHSVLYLGCLHESVNGDSFACANTGLAVQALADLVTVASLPVHLCIVHKHTHCASSVTFGIECFALGHNDSSSNSSSSSQHRPRTLSPRARQTSIPETQQ